MKTYLLVRFVLQTQLIESTIILVIIIYALTVIIIGLIPELFIVIGIGVPSVGSQDELIIHDGRNIQY